jgi:hypothetical protein
MCSAGSLNGYGTTTTNETYTDSPNSRHANPAVNFGSWKRSGPVSGAADNPPADHPSGSRAVIGGADLAVGDVPDYATDGYNTWQVGPGEDSGRRFDLMPAG